MNFTTFTSRTLLFLFLFFFLRIEPGVAAWETEDTFLSVHNYARGLIGVPPLAWDPKLANAAQSWADYLAKYDLFQHADSKTRWGLGENLYMISWWKNLTSDGMDALASWLEESTLYDHDAQVCQSGKVCGHYTQMIWNTTKKVGCAKSVRKAKNKTKIFWVCRYDPTGNIIGQKPF